MKTIDRTLKRTILLVFSLALVMVTTVTAEGVGVKVGDWAKYSDFVFTWDMPEDSEEPEDFARINEFDWAKVEVLDVDGTNATVKFTMHYKNGTEVSETNSGDVRTSQQGFPFLIEANLNTGDKIPWEFIPEWELYINGTTSRTYAGASRSVSYVNVTRTSGGSSMTLELYWDRAKGILCEMLMSASMTYMGNTYSMSMSVNITETNMWGSAGLLPDILKDYWLWAVIVAVVVPICIVVFVMHRHAAHSTPPSPP